VRSENAEKKDDSGQGEEDEKDYIGDGVLTEDCSSEHQLTPNSVKELSRL
jgi:hypothetical protein